MSLLISAWVEFLGGAKITSVHDLVSQEEREVLGSIYDSDDCFKEQSATSFTYRVSNGREGLSDRLLHVGGLQNSPTCLRSDFHIWWFVDDALDENCCGDKWSWPVRLG